MTPAVLQHTSRNAHSAHAREGAQTGGSVVLLSENSLASRKTKVIGIPSFVLLYEMNVEFRDETDSAGAAV